MTSEAYCHICCDWVESYDMYDPEVCEGCFATLCEEADWSENCVLCHEPLAQLVEDEDGDSYAICSGCAHTKADGRGTEYPDDRIP